MAEVTNNKKIKRVSKNNLTKAFEAVESKIRWQGGEGENSVQQKGTGAASVGKNSFAEGFTSRSLGEASHAEGWGTNAAGLASHAEGMQNSAIGDCSHAEGRETTANGKYSHSEGHQTQTSGMAEFACGTNNKTTDLENYQPTQEEIDSIKENGHVDLSFNGSPDKVLHSVGNGISDENRHNAHEIRQNGAHYIPDIHATKDNGSPYPFYEVPMMNLQDKLKEIEERANDSGIYPFSGQVATLSELKSKKDGEIYFLEGQNGAGGFYMVNSSASKGYIPAYFDIGGNSGMQYLPKRNRIYRNGSTLYWVKATDMGPTVTNYSLGLLNYELFENIAKRLVIVEAFIEQFTKLSDNKTYGIINGKPELIAESGEAVVTVSNTATMELSPDNAVAIPMPAAITENSDTNEENTTEDEKESE